MEGNVVIVGGGVIGAAVCYYLTQKGAKNVTLIERFEVACHASGKSGGFLARGWGNSVTAPLHKLSFDLIEELSSTLGLSSYRNIPTLSVTDRKGKNLASWLDGEVSSKMMDSATAQVTPSELTHSLLNAACESGATLKIATVDGLVIEQGVIKGVKLDDGSTLPCEKCVITMGVWSTLLGDWIGIRDAFPMEGIRSTSVVYQSGMESLKEHPYALFCGEDDNGCHLEVYPRPNGEVYICGCGGSEHIRGDQLRKGGKCERPEQVLGDPLRAQAASKSFSSMTSVAHGKDPEVTQGCMRPCPPDGLPMIGKVQSVKNLYIAAGHNCWGILWSAGTGLLMSQLVLGEPTSIDLSPYSPQRFMRSSKSRGKHKHGSEPVGEQW